MKVWREVRSCYLMWKWVAASTQQALCSLSRSSRKLSGASRELNLNSLITVRVIQRDNSSCTIYRIMWIFDWTGRRTVSRLWFLPHVTSYFAGEQINKKDQSSSLARLNMIILIISPHLYSYSSPGPVSHPPCLYRLLWYSHSVFTANLRAVTRK